MTEHWHNLPKEAGESSSLEILRSCPDLVLGNCCVLAPAGNKKAQGHSLTPSHQCNGEKNQKEKAKLTDWDKDSLTEQQKDKNNNDNNTDKKNIQSTICSLPNAQFNPELQNYPPSTSSPT